MGVRLTSDSRRHSFATPVRNGLFHRSAGGAVTQARGAETPRMRFVYDGTVGKEGLPSALDSAEIWIDPTALIAPGYTQLGITATLVSGAGGSCEVFGANAPSEYAYRVGDADGADIVAQMATRWELLATLLPAQSQNIFGESVTFTLYRLVFATGVAGTVSFASL